MVFSSLPFLFLFLPIVVLFYHLLRHCDYDKYCLPFLFIASLFFYAYWNPIYLSIILTSMIVNYYIGQYLSARKGKNKLVFIGGLVFNIGLLAYFKYTDFLITITNDIFSTNTELLHIVLPIGISFYTFQQIAYLSDIYTKKHVIATQGFLHYGLFISFFPQLIAGPIVHHKEMMPQFADDANKGINWKNMYTGLCFLSIGLAKKVIIADTLAPMVGYIFDQAASLTFTEALLGALAYTVQLYMDFSGYADMAIGCALFFNIHLPYNFNSPYKSVNIQDFWRRWHMTLSRWLRDYLYIPLGGNRKGEGRTLCNLFLTFLIGGLWHGAGWTFILWGSMHGGALILHRLWSHTWNKTMPVLCGWLCTFTFVMLAWIPFRAVSFERLQVFIDALAGQSGWMMQKAFCTTIAQITFNRASLTVFAIYLTLLFTALVIALVGINSQKLAFRVEDKKIFLWCSFLFIVSFGILFAPNYQSEFIYFQF